MDDHNEMYEIGLTAPMEMAEEYRLDEMLPMMGLKIGKRCIILISRSVNAAEILDTLETLRCAEEKLMMVLEDACGRCDSVCEAQALPTDNTEKEMLQKIPDVLSSVYTRSGQNSTPNSNATNLHSSQKRCCSFCISSSNASPTFQVQKSIFHQMTKPIQVTVILPLLLAISFSRNDDIHSSISGISNDLIGVIPTIGQ